MTVEIISGWISRKVWDRTEVELATPGSAVCVLVSLILCVLLSLPLGADWVDL